MNQFFYSVIIHSEMDFLYFYYSINYLFLQYFYYSMYFHFKLNSISIKNLLYSMNYLNIRLCYYHHFSIIFYFYHLQFDSSFFQFIFIYICLKAYHYFKYLQTITAVHFTIIMIYYHFKSVQIFHQYFVGGQLHALRLILPLMNFFMIPTS